MTSALNIQMFGNFSVQYGDRVVDDTGNRMKKVWLLLAYLIFCRNSVTTQEGYLALMQGAGAGESADPGGRLKAVFYRVRTMLNQLDENAGHNWIIRKNGTYTWNPDIPVRLDAEEFEDLCRRGAAEGDEDQRLELLQQAMVSRAGLPAAFSEAARIASVRNPRELMNHCTVLKKAMEYAQGNVSCAAVCGWLAWELR